jgi:Tfp pilus assembly protein PilX
MDQRKGIEEPETRPHDIGERGTAVVIALFVMALIGGFVALAMTRTASEAASVGNESAETRTFYAAQGSLEMMTRNFNKIFETKLNPTLADRNNVMSAPVPGLSQTAGGQYRFNQVLQQTGPSTTNTLTGGPYAGLYALRDTWRLRTTATDVNSGTQVQLTRDVLNNRVPIFQFGVFYVRFRRPSAHEPALFPPPEFERSVLRFARDGRRTHRYAGEKKRRHRQHLVCLHPYQECVRSVQDATT